MCRGSNKVEKHCPSGPGKTKDASVLRGFFFSFAYFDPCQSWLLKLKSTHYFGVTFQPCIHLAQCEREQTRGSFGTWNHVSWFHFQCEILFVFLMRRVFSTYVWFVHLDPNNTLSCHCWLQSHAGVDLFTLVLTASGSVWMPQVLFIWNSCYCT